jgi:hypothetical protein
VATSPSPSLYPHRPKMLWLLLAQLFASDVVAHQDWWLQGLPGCWQSCLSNTEAGCNSSKCECIYPQSVVTPVNDYQVSARRVIAAHPTCPALFRAPYPSATQVDGASSWFSDPYRRIAMLYIAQYLTMSWAAPTLLPQIPSSHHPQRRVKPSRQQ